MMSIRTSFTLFVSSTFSRILSSLPPVASSSPISRRVTVAGFTTGVTAFTSLSIHNPKPAFAAAAAKEISSQSCLSDLSSGANSLTGPSHLKRRSSNIMALSSQTNSIPNSIDTGYLTSASAYALDQELMSQPGFSLEQLMELAGLSVAEAAYQSVSKMSLSPQLNDTKEDKKSILILCGPGNNGGDGLVAARHLHHFGFHCIVIYPKRSKGVHFVNLVTQCENLGIPVLNEIPEIDNSNSPSYGLIIDALFGFSFKGEPREPLATLLRQMISMQSTSDIPVLSVDIPSGWHVENGNISDEDSGYSFEPEFLISLTAPKECARGFTGTHFIGGRFLPDFLADKYNVKMPPYEGTAQVFEIPSGKQNEDERNNESTDNDDWAKEYQNYLNEQEMKAMEEKDEIDAAEIKGEGVEDWAIGYAKFCEEKEKMLAKKDKEKRERQRKELEQQ